MEDPDRATIAVDRDDIPLKDSSRRVFYSDD
jgi:hypothetical protein